LTGALGRSLRRIARRGNRSSQLNFWLKRLQPRTDQVDQDCFLSGWATASWVIDQCVTRWQYLFSTLLVRTSSSKETAVFNGFRRSHLQSLCAETL
jgi:hypothetical protein